MKTLIILVICLIFTSCSENKITNSVQGNKTDEQIANPSYTTHILLQPNETISFDGSVVGFNGWKYANINTDVELELRINNQETIIQFTHFNVDGTMFENMELINHMNDVANVDIHIIGQR